MSESIIFRIFKSAQKALRGTGLGRIKLLRDVRDLIYNLVRPQQTMEIAVLDFRMIVDPNQSGVVPDLLRDGVFEKTETAVLQKHLRSGNVFVDIGSNIGYYTVIASRIVGESGKVYAFEPEPENFKFLLKNIELNKLSNVVTTQKAVSDKSGSTTLFLNEGNTGGHHLADRGDGSTGITIESVTLDEFLGPQAPRVDILKMDIEGYEPFAFRGMQQIMRNNRDILLITEYYPEMISKAGSDPDQYLAEISHAGFTMHLINEVTGLLTAATSDEIHGYCQKYEYANLLCKR